MHRFNTPLPLLAALALLASTAPAHAQYSWIGENGVRQFSDRPPPPSTPPHKILKAPARSAAAPSAVKPATAAATPAPPPAAKAPSTVAEREAAYRERVKQRAEQDKKDAEQAQRQRDLAERCRSALQVRAQVESGIRITNIDPNGERSVVSDEEKAVQLARANQVLAECRQAGPG